MTVLDFLLGPSYEVVIAGMPGGANTTAMLQALRMPFLPNKSVLFVLADDPSHIQAGPVYPGIPSPHAQAIDYVCTDNTCRRPTTDPADLRNLGTCHPVP